FSQRRRCPRQSRLPRRLAIRTLPSGRRRSSPRCLRGATRKSALSFGQAPLGTGDWLATLLRSVANHGKKALFPPRRLRARTSLSCFLSAACLLLKLFNFLGRFGLGHLLGHSLAGFSSKRVNVRVLCS